MFFLFKIVTRGTIGFPLGSRLHRYIESCGNIEIYKQKYSYVTSKKNELRRGIRRKKMNTTKVMCSQESETEASLDLGICFKRSRSTFLCGND